MNTAQLLDFPRWLVQTHVSRLPLECAQRQRQRSLVGNGVEQPQRLRSFDFDSFARATPQLPARQWTRSSRLDRSQISGPVVRGPLFLSLSRLSRLVLSTEAASSRSFSSRVTLGRGPLLFSFPFFFSFFRLVSIIPPPLLSPPSRLTCCVFSTSIHQRRKNTNSRKGNTSFIHDLRLPTVGAIFSLFVRLPSPPGFETRTDVYKIVYVYIQFRYT